MPGGGGFNPALGRQRQAEFCEFKACLVYRVTAHTAGATQRNLVSKKIKSELYVEISEDC